MKSPLITIAKRFVAATSLALLFSPPALADPPQFSIKDITPPESRILPAGASELNNVGQAVGTFAFDATFLYDDRDGTWVELPVSTEFDPNDINEMGAVVGTADEGGPVAQLFENGVVTDIGRFEGALTDSFALGVNDSGDVTGSLDPESDNRFMAFLYSGGDTHLLDLGVDQGSCVRSDAEDINNAGQIVGQIQIPTDSGCKFRAFLHEDGGTLLIGDLVPDQETRAIRINESGQVLVFVRNGLFAGGAYLYSDGELQPIGNDQTNAHGLNDLGWVVGATGPRSETRAFLWIDGELYDLNELVPDLTGWAELESAGDVNDTGQIVGSGRRPDGVRGAFLLTPLETKVKIDVRPFHKKNKINLRSKGNIAVAIRSTGKFDATQVDWETVKFGPGEATERHERIHLKDLQKDGDLDAVLHFRIRESGIRCKDTKVTLTGRTFEGLPFRGTDRIHVVKCRR